MLVLRFLHTFEIQSYITNKNSRLLTENHASYDIFIGDMFQSLLVQRLTTEFSAVFNIQSLIPEFTQLTWIEK